MSSANSRLFSSRVRPLDLWKRRERLRQSSYWRDLSTNSNDDDKPWLAHKQRQEHYKEWRANHVIYRQNLLRERCHAPTLCSKQPDTMYSYKNRSEWNDLKSKPTTSQPLIDAHKKPNSYSRLLSSVHTLSHNDGANRMKQRNHNIVKQLQAPNPTSAQNHLSSVHPSHFYTCYSTISIPQIHVNSIRHFSTQSPKQKDDETDESTKDSNATNHPTRMQAFSTQLQSIPNIITLTRIVATPYLSYLIITDQYGYALGGCFLAAFSDYMDGYIAKNYNSATVLGTYLDPLADKLIINTLAVSLGYQDILPIWIVSLWLARDVGLMATTYWWVRKNTDRSKGQAVIDPGRTPLQVHPTNISKVNTVLQFFTLFGGIGVGMMDGAGQDILLGLCYITAGTTIASGVSYLGGSRLKMSTNMKKSEKTNGDS